MQIIFRHSRSSYLRGAKRCHWYQWTAMVWDFNYLKSKKERVRKFALWVQARESNLALKSRLEEVDTNSCIILYCTSPRKMCGFLDDWTQDCTWTCMSHQGLIIRALSPWTAQCIVHWLQTLHVIIKFSALFVINTWCMLSMLCWSCLLWLLAQHFYHRKILLGLLPITWVYQHWQWLWILQDGLIWTLQASGALYLLIGEMLEMFGPSSSRWIVRSDCLPRPKPSRPVIQLRRYF